MIGNKVDSSPPVAVLMATYNDESYIDEAVKSVLNQTMSNFNFVIVDDASSDYMSRILARYVNLDNRIRVVRNESNLGLTKSLNIGLKYSDSPFIARLDADDVCMPERLEKQLAYMQTHPKCDFLGTRAIVIDEAGHNIKKTKSLPPDMNVKQYLLEHGTPFAHSSVMIRKSALDELGGYNEDWKARQDYELWLRAAFAGKRLDCLNECQIYFRYRDLSYSSRSDSNLMCNLVLRGCYRAKEKGQEVDLQTLKAELEKSWVLQKYVGSIKMRRAIKTMIAYFNSCNTREGVRVFMKLVHLFVTTGPPISKLKENMHLDKLCRSCNGSS